MTANPSDRRPNRLLHQKSPYLLQHAYNPVDWYPWGEEALAKARQDDKPIFLSIGYSTCYWCHVMEHESFEHPGIAQAINEHFVPIKVDREERPDLDAVYMSAVMAMTGQGGWPMTVFLTPDGRPFWGGTYFPPENRGGMPGLPSVLQGVAEAWRTRRPELLKSSEQLTRALQPGTPAAGKTLTEEVLRSAVGQYTEQYDGVHGGFGPPPKFPRSHSLSLLLRAWAREHDAEILRMVETTLDAMASGGLQDQIGGGFHRYATDERWLVPHFEKMLYDQALLSRAYLEAAQATGHARHGEVARATFEYVLRDLRDANGAFYSAEDAGEVGKEGDWYVWTPEEFERVLGREEAALAGRMYGVSPGGNFEGASILHLPRPAESVAADVGIPVDDLRRRMAAARERLLQARAQRSRPHRDDKILTDWNGLMISSLAYGSRVLGEARYAQAAAEAASFLLARLQDNGRSLDSARDRGERASFDFAQDARPEPVEGRAQRVEPRLLHRWRDGEADIPGFLDDYAFLSAGLLELYEATFEIRWLQEAQRLVREMVRLFGDPAGGFFFTGEYHERLITQTKELYDGATPSGNSMAALVLVRLGQLVMDPELQRCAEQLFQIFAEPVRQAPHAFPQFLTALDLRLGPSQEIVIAGDPAALETREMLALVNRRFLPRATLVLHPSGREAEAIERLIPFIAAQHPMGGRTTAYVCQRHVCRLPTADLEAFRRELDGLQ